MLLSTVSPRVNKAAAICLVPEFLAAPETRTVPSSGGPGRTTMRSVMRHPWYGFLTYRALKEVPRWMPTLSRGRYPGYMANPPQNPDRNLALELVRVTETAALAAGRWFGRGDKEAADQAAVDAMRLMLNSVAMSGVVVIGEGEKDHAPMLFNGEEIGAGGPNCDIAVDPIDGTTLTAYGRSNAISVIALAERGTMFDPGPCVYMDKIVVGPEAAGVIDLDAAPRDNLFLVAKALGENIEDLTVIILDRPRHENLIQEVRQAGARIQLIQDGDVAGAIAAAWSESTANILMGVGGTPEGVIAACALACLGGEIYGRMQPRNDEERRIALDAGYDLDQILTTSDLVSGQDVFFAATGISDGDFLKGIRYRGDGATSQSIVMRSKSGTIRTIDSTHRWQKLMRYTEPAS